MTKAVIAIGISLVLLTGGISCSKRHEPGAGGRGRRGLAAQGRGQAGEGRGRAASIRLTAAELGAVDLATGRVSLQPMASRLRATGKVFASPFRKAIVSYPFPARVAEMHVRPGDWVKAGQPLVTLQSETVGEAKSDYYKALADLELAQSNHDREKRLFDRGAGAGKNLKAAESGLKVAQATLEACEKKLHVLGFTEEQVRQTARAHEINATITLFAPLRGKIGDNGIALGTMVDQSSEILTIVDPSLLCIDADIYERDIASIREGQEVEVTVPAYPGSVFKGKVQYIGDVLKDETRTVTVRTQVENAEYRLKPGMFASLEIVLERQARALTVPLSAVLNDRDRDIVFVSRDGGYELRVVKLGSRLDGSVEVVSGLEEGDTVVTRGAFQLKSKLYGESLKGSHLH